MKIKMFCMRLLRSALMGVLRTKEEVVPLQKKRRLISFAGLLVYGFTMKGTRKLLFIESHIFKYNSSLFRDAISHEFNNKRFLTREWRGNKFFIDIDEEKVYKSISYKECTKELLDDIDDEEMEILLRNDVIE